MTSTVGYWCDECRRKYVQHVCRDGLPCGHPKEEAVYVYAKHYGKGQDETVLLECREFKAGFTVRPKPRDPNTLYSGGEARALHGYWVFIDGEKMSVAEWLHLQPPRIIRAYLERWQSWKQPPTWRLMETFIPFDEQLRRMEEQKGESSE